MHKSSTANALPDADYGHELSADDPALVNLAMIPAGAEHRWLLQRDNSGQLQVLDQHKPRQRPLRIELGSSEMQRRIAGGRQQPLARACGLHKADNVVIHDLTAGLCRDAWCLAALGAHVTAWERHPLLFALIRDALAKANSPVVQRMDAAHRDGRTAAVLPNTVVYLDPMFPVTGKRAAPGLEMQILQALVGADEDATALWQTAMNSAASRVVLKRPPRGAKVQLGQPDASFGGGRAVYDVYLQNR